MDKKGDRRFVIGDIHGCADELVTLLVLLRRHYSVEDNAEPGRIFFVGDLVDRGPEAADTVDLVMKGCREKGYRCILGNHDEMFLQNLLLFRPDLVRVAGVDTKEMEPSVSSYRFAPERVLHHWLGQGGDATINSYGGHPDRPETWDIPPEHIAFLASLPLAIRDEELVITHAWAGAEAVDAAIRHSTNPWRIPIHLRESLLWDRDPPDHPPAGVHVSGHTARTAPLVTEHAIGVDTGCCFANRLTAYNPDEHIFLQVACHA